MTVSMQEAPDRLPKSGTYKVAPEASTIALTTRHLFGLGRVRGSFAVTGGRVTVDDGRAGADEVGAGVAVTVAAGSVDTGNARRDKAVRSPAFLNSGEHPEISFRSTGVGREDGAWLVRGEVKARGTTAPVDLRVAELRETAEGLIVRATATVDRYAHGMTRFRGLAGRLVHLEITARAERTGRPPVRTA